MGKAGRRRTIDFFSWPRIAERTRDLYAGLL
jgi:alpha-maltose-1-phosphate synthase